MSPTPATRTLPLVLRRQLRARPVHLVLAPVTDVPDATHVEIELNGEFIVVPRLASFDAALGDVAYCLAGRSLVIALGTVK